MDKKQKKILVFGTIILLLVFLQPQPKEMKKTSTIVVFRTNADGGSYSQGDWIAYDYGQDSGLEGRLGGTLSIITNPPECLLTDYYGKCFIEISDEYFIQYSGSMYRKFSNVASGAELSESPTEPYASNNQEVYEESSCECSSGECCDGCNYLPPITECTNDCDHLDTQCRDYHDETTFCAGDSSNCPITSCVDYTNAPAGTSCAIGECDGNGVCEGQSTGMTFPQMTVYLNAWVNEEPDPCGA